MMKFKHLRADQEFHKVLRTLKERMEDDEFAINIYRALSNMRWRKIKDPSMVYSCTWRYAGGLVAEIRNVGENYMKFYCRGDEGAVDSEIQTLLAERGWEPHPWPTEGGKECMMKQELP